MAVRTTVDIPEPLHERLKERAERSGTSIRSLIVRALEETYAAPQKGRKVTGPLITGKGKLGPRFPVDQNPHDLVLS
ncbi:hypothetical protein DYQ86_26000 [Acidobacteria bacterium AB60]|nr:hypothetical protein DYQ86_26000 [Acidobacteria bacterium AB60]